MNWTILGYLVENNTFEFVEFARIRFTFFLSAAYLFNFTVEKKSYYLYE